MTLGKQIKKYRLARNLTQLQVAEMLNLTKGAVTSWEKDRQSPTFRNMLRLADILGVNASDLILRTGELKETMQRFNDQLTSDPLDITVSPMTPPKTPLTDEFLESIPIFSYAKKNIDEYGYIIQAPIGKIAKPLALSNHNDLYAVYITGDSMSPACDAGDLRVVTPHVPCRPGDTVICVVNEPETDEKACFIKKLERMEAKDNGQELIVLSQYNPYEELILDRTNLCSMHKILITRELFGV